MLNKLARNGKWSLMWENVKISILAEKLKKKVIHGQSLQSSKMQRELDVLVYDLQKAGLQVLASMFSK